MITQLRTDPELRDRALQIVSQRRATSAEEPEDPQTTGTSAPKRLRDDMLGDAERGLSTKDLARITGYSEHTMRAYLHHPERRRQVLERIRNDPEVREKALAIVAEKRGAT